MQIGGMLIGYYALCPRKFWLSANGILMEHESEAVALGRLLHEESYERANKDLVLNLSFEGIPLVGKLDGANLKQGILYETKKSRSAEESHIWQVKFYLWLLVLSGQSHYTAVIQYPLLKKTQAVSLTQKDEAQLASMVKEIVQLYAQPVPPDRIPSRKLCAKCAYEEWCYG